MSKDMIQAVLRMPIECWSDDDGLVYALYIDYNK